MNKKNLIPILLLILISFIQQPVFAINEAENVPPVPTEGTASNNLYYADSGNIEYVEGIDSLLIDWCCSIQNIGSTLCLTGEQMTYNYVSELKFTLFLQKWNGQNWVDVDNWTFYNYDSISLVESCNTDFESGNYYRVHTQHYARNGSQTDIQYSTSSYIFIQ